MGKRQGQPQDDKPTPCGSESSSAIEWGEWKENKNDALKSARVTAKESAQQACDSGCKQGEECKYHETSVEMLEKETNTPTRGVETYRYKAKSSGRCECQKKQ